MTTGYFHPEYAASLGEFGTPRKLPVSGGWILERNIPGTPYKDAMGPYPLFCCENWAGLKEDLNDLQQKGRLISLALVTDPFAVCDEMRLLECFIDKMMPYKKHFLVRLPCEVAATISKHHAYYARKALRDLRVEEIVGPSAYAEEWTGLYEVLKNRHGLTGVHRFSPAAFRRQLAIPGAVYFRALSGEECVGGHIWYVHGDVAYSHLAAFTVRGYKLMASYALYWKAIEYFASRVQWLEIGAGAGMDTDADDGLTRFKRGWATDTRPVYFCGRIFNHEKYNQLAVKSGQQNEAWFPAYRAGKYIKARNNAHLEQM